MKAELLSSLVFELLSFRLEIKLCQGLNEVIVLSEFSYIQQQTDLPFSRQWRGLFYLSNFFNLKFPRGNFS